MPTKPSRLITCPEHYNLKSWQPRSMQLKTNAQTGLPCAPDILLVCPCCSPTSLVTLNALHKTASVPCPLKPVYHSPTSITRSTVTCHPNRQLCLLPTCISRSLCFHLFPAEKHKIPESGVLSGFRLFGGSESGTSASASNSLHSLISSAFSA